MNDLINLINDDSKPSQVFGTGYDGPPKPSDLETAAYLVGFLVAVAIVIYVIF